MLYALFGQLDSVGMFVSAEKKQSVNELHSIDMQRHETCVRS